MARFVTQLVVKRDHRVGSDKWRLLNDLVYHSDVVGGAITAPAGMTSDFASIPKIFRIFVKTDDPLLQAPSVIHDWLYRHATLDNGKRVGKLTVDRVYNEAMKVSGVRPYIRWPIMFYLLTFGIVIWRRIRKKRG